MLTTIKIKNFKGIKDTTIYCQEDYNVLIGANNVGKTTVFGAIHLWKMCYDTNIKKKSGGNPSFSILFSVGYLVLEF